MGIFYLPWLLSFTALQTLRAERLSAIFVAGKKRTNRDKKGPFGGFSRQMRGETELIFRVITRQATVEY